MNHRHPIGPIAALFFALSLLAGCASTGSTSTPGFFVHTNDSGALETAARASLDKLVAENEGAAALYKEAVGAMVFPKVLKAGLTFGGQYGEGVLFEKDATTGYFNSISASFGLQAGVQHFGYVLLITNDTALDHVKHAQGWELGVGPSLVIADKGIGRALTTTTVRKDVYAFMFDQKGLMAGSGLQGTKVSPIFRSETEQ